MFGLCGGECVVEEVAPPILPSGEGKGEDYVFNFFELNFINAI
jgi:hypothetical protein